MRISDWSSDVCSSDLLTINLEVAEVKAVTQRGVNKEELVGKKHNESFYIVPAKAEEGIGLIRAFYADIGLPNGGVIGAAEDDDGNQIEGFADGIVGHTFQAKIVRVATKDADRKRDVSGKSVLVRVDMGGRSNINKNKTQRYTQNK